MTTIPQDRRQEQGMRAEKWTKGPWRIEGNCVPWARGQSTWDEVGASIVASDLNNPVVVGGCQDEQGGAVGVARIEDAHLIAAAPALAEAAHGVLMGTLSPAEEDEDGPRYWLNISAAAFKKIELALAAARGESEGAK